MASSLFKVQVINIQETICDLRLFIIHPDQSRFYATGPFAIQLIWDAMTSSDRVVFPIGQRITLDDVSNPDFMYENEDTYISMVEFLEFKNYPRTINLDDLSEKEFQEYWLNEELLSQAIIRITVTDPRWIEHLEIGIEWESSAFNM